MRNLAEAGFYAGKGEETGKPSTDQVVAMDRIDHGFNVADNFVVAGNHRCSIRGYKVTLF